MPRSGQIRRNRAVFVDRDGVINHAVVRGGKPFPPSGLDELRIVDGVPEAVARFRDAGMLVIIATNQPDVATGKQARAVVEAIHRRIRDAISVDDVKVCYHSDEDNCACRKPKPEMLFEAAREWSIDLGQSYMVGDRWRDIDAGKAAGCRTYWVDHGYDERPATGADAIVGSLAEAASLIIAHATREGSADA